MLNLLVWTVFIYSFPDNYSLLKRLLLLLLILFCALCSRSQISIQNYQLPYYQNFNTLLNAGNTNTLFPAGWAFLESGSGGNNSYSANDGTNFGGNTYSFGSIGSTERALGSISTGTVASRYGAHFINNTGGTITQFTIEYTGEQWNLGSYGTHDSIEFQYSTNATTLNNGTWTDFSALDFIGPISSGIGRPLDGNLTENRIQVSAIIEGLYLPTGSSFSIRWVDAPAIGTDDGLAIDDFSITASDPCAIQLSSFSPATGPVNTVVTLTGDNFSDVVEVLFNGTPATSFEIVNNTLIKSIVPAGAMTGRLSCITSCSAISESDFVVLGANCEVTSGVIISELCDPQIGYETDRFIEIFNPTNLPVDLTGWSVRAIPNNVIDSECSISVMCWNLSGEIAPGQALTCGYTNTNGVIHDFTNPEWYTGSALNGACYLWNGQWRDGAALYDNNNIRVDGVMREQTANDWYSNRSLYRNSEICTPNPNSSYLEWSVTDTVSTAGAFPSTPHSHSSDCIISSLPVISQQPIPQESCEGSFVEFEVLASGGVGPLLYQWYELNNGTWVNLTDQLGYSGSTSPILTVSAITAAMDGFQYYCRITNSDGDCYISSNSASLTVSGNSGPTTITIWHQ